MTEDAIYNIIANYFVKLKIRYRNPRIGNRRYTVDVTNEHLVIQLHGPGEKLVIFRDGQWAYRGPWEADVEKLAEHYKRRLYEFDMAAVRAQAAAEREEAARADKRLDKFRALFKTESKGS